MAAGSVVKHFDVIERISPGQVAGFVDPLANAFFLHAAERGLGHRVVLAVASAAHAGLLVVGCAETFPVITAVLAALVGVNDHSFFGLAPPKGHQQRPKPIRASGLVSSTNRAPCAHTDLPLRPITTIPAGADIGDVGYPGFWGAIDGELTVEMIGAIIERRPVIGSGAL